MRRSVLSAAVAAAVVALALTACAPSGGAPTASAHPTRKASATPSASATPTEKPLPAGTLFRISAVATATDGTTATLVETVQAPADQTDQQTADAKQLDSECDGWREAFPKTQFVVAAVTTTVQGGGDWSSDDGQIAVDMAGYPVWSGDQRPYQELCATALTVIPGQARAVSPVAAGKPDAEGGWAVFRYGFSVAGASGGATAGAGAPVISACRVQLGAAADPSIIASAWPTHPQTNGGSACAFGGS
jgi:hypothetical protein